MKELEARRGLIRSISLICLVLFFALPASAQRGGSAASGGRVAPERAQIDKPTDTAVAIASTSEDCDPNTVVGTCPGTFVFGYGFNANASPRHAGAQTERAGLSFAVYVSRRVFVEVDNDNVISIKAAPADRVTGFGDTSVYLGADALLEGPRRPAVALLYGIKAPTASAAKGIGSGEVDHTLAVAIGKTLGSRTYLEADAGDYIAGRTNATGFDHFPFASMFLNQKLGARGRYKGHFEIGGDFATSISNATMYNLNYLETRLSNKDAKTYLGLRTGVRFGLTPNVSRAGFYLGLRVAGNLKTLFN